jgi:hypothetical protein
MKRADRTIDWSDPRGVAMKSRLAPTALRTSVALLAFVAACGGERVVARAVGVDTLASGALHVRNTGEGLWAREGAPPWELIEELRIGRVNGNTPDVFGQARSVVPDAAGRIWVLDSQAAELRLFDADGRFVRTVGGKGDGPGQLGGATPPCAFRGPGDEIWTEEPRRRWQRFDSAGKLIGQHAITSVLACATRVWRPDGRLLVTTARQDPATGEARALFVLHEPRSDSLIPRDTFPAPELPPSRMIVWARTGGADRSERVLPFWPRAFSIVAPSGQLWISDGGSAYAIRQQTIAGDTIMVVERAYEPVPIDEAVRQRAIEEFQPEGMVAEGGFDPNQVPRVYPPFDGFHVGADGTLWVRRTLAGGVGALDVFTADGEYLGEAGIPDDFGGITLHYATADKLYGIARDALGVQYVVRLGVRKGGG